MSIFRFRGTPVDVMNENSSSQPTLSRSIHSTAVERLRNREPGPESGPGFGHSKLKGIEGFLCSAAGQRRQLSQSRKPRQSRQSRQSGETRRSGQTTVKAVNRAADVWFIRGYVGIPQQGPEGSGLGMCSKGLGVRDWESGGGHARSCEGIVGCCVKPRTLHGYLADKKPSPPRSLQ